MASTSGKKQDKSSERVVKPSSTIFFVNKDLVRLISSNRSANIVYLFNITQNKEQTMLYADFKKHRKRAYTIINTARLLNCGATSLRRYMSNGIIEPPVGANPNGERKFQVKSYYSEDYIFTIRHIMSTIHAGRPRTDGRVTRNKLLTEQELRAKMGDALILYTKTEDGRFIPVWQEQTY